jgi:hypothetical protein
MRVLLLMLLTSTTALAQPAEPAPSRYPRDIISRVLTYPKGMVVAGVDVATATSNFFDPAGLRVLAGYGITDDFELNFAHYSFSTDDAGKGSIDAGLGYKLLRGAAGGKLEVIARAQTGYSLLAEDLNPLLLGVHAQYNITPTIAVITAPPGTGHVSIGLGDVNSIAVNLPVSFAVQPTPTFYVQLDTNFATLAINDDAGDSTYFGADVTPIFAAAYLNVIPAADVFAGVGSTNLTPPDGVDVGDTFYVLAGARYYGGI